jgi:hypothetical protein
MQYGIKSIETKYKGILFRSRLEAKWASFFDLLGWKWRYEPADFNGWIPDFAIYGHDCVYVEVKPVIDFPADVAGKIDASGCQNEVLILGETGPDRMGGGDWLRLGWLREAVGYADEPIREWWWDAAALGKWEDGNGTVGFCHSEAAFTDRISGGYDGGCHGGKSLCVEDVESLWAEACNSVRWTPR